MWKYPLKINLHQFLKTWSTFRCRNTLPFDFTSITFLFSYLALDMWILNFFFKYFFLALVFKSNWPNSHRFLCNSLQPLDHTNQCIINQHDTIRLEKIYELIQKSLKLCFENMKNQKSSNYLQYSVFTYCVYIYINTVSNQLTGD